jgi:Mrp family chromosome partitioning ATPase
MQMPESELAKVNERMSRVKCKLLVLSGKGGVGKSTVAANIATALALEGKKVGLLDIDVHGPTIPQLLGLNRERIEMKDEALIPAKIGDNLEVMSIGFLLPEEDSAVIWRGPMKYKLIKEFLEDVEWGELDYLIADSPPGTGDEPLSIAQLLGKMDGAIIVATPQEVAISAVRRSITFCNHLAIPIVGVIENMSGFICPNCGARVDIFKEGGAKKMAEKYGIKFLGRVPIDPNLVYAGDEGKPFLLNYQNSETAKIFTEIVRSIREAVEK